MSPCTTHCTASLALQTYSLQACPKVFTLPPVLLLFISLTESHILCHGALPALYAQIFMVVSLQSRLEEAY